MAKKEPVDSWLSLAARVVKLLAAIAELTRMLLK
jgi:hypothetical protein